MSTDQMSLGQLKDLFKKPITIFGGIASIAAFLISLFGAKQTTQDAIVVGLTTLIASLLLEVYLEVVLTRQEVAKHAEDTAKICAQVEPAIQHFVHLQRAGKLRGKIEAVTQACSDTQLAGIPSGKLRNFLVTQFDEHLNRFVELKNNKFDADEESWFTIDLDILAECQDSILAISHADATRIWREPAGHSYWTMNVNRVQKGVRCERLFMLTNDELHEPERWKMLVEIVKEQAAAGVEVLLVHEDTCPVNTRRDMAIFDNKVVTVTKIKNQRYEAGIDVFWGQFELSRFKAEYETVKTLSLKPEKFAAYYRVSF